MTWRVPFLVVFGFLGSLGLLAVASCQALPLRPEAALVATVPTASASGAALAPSASAATLGQAADEAMIWAQVPNRPDCP